MTTTKTLAEIRGAGVCPKCGERTVSLHVYGNEPGRMAKCSNKATCGYIERFVDR